VDWTDSGFSFAASASRKRAMQSIEPACVAGPSKDQKGSFALQKYRKKIADFLRVYDNFRQIFIPCFLKIPCISHNYREFEGLLIS